MTESKRGFMWRLEGEFYNKELQVFAAHLKYQESRDGNVAMGLEVLKEQVREDAWLGVLRTIRYAGHPPLYMFRDRSGYAK